MNALTSSKERLSKISHHFLSDETVEIKVKKSEPVNLNLSATYSVFIDNQPSNFPIYKLAHSFNQHDHPASIVRIEQKHPRSIKHDNRLQQLDNEDFLEFNLDNVLSALNNDDPRKNAISLIPIYCYNLPLISYFNRILYPIDANKTSEIQAYQVIKDTLSARSISIGVILINPKNMLMAKQYMDKLAGAVHQFLGKALINYGHLDLTNNDDNQQLNNLSRILLLEKNDWIYSRSLNSTTANNTYLEKPEHLAVHRPHCGIL